MFRGWACLTLRFSALGTCDSVPGPAVQWLVVEFEDKYSATVTRELGRDWQLGEGVMVGGLLGSLMQVCHCNSNSGALVKAEHFLTCIDLMLAPHDR